MRVDVVGPGRLGRSLGALLARAGHDARLVGRDGPQADGEIVLLTVPDRDIEAAARGVPGGRVVLHCSGATDWQVLRPHRPAGSLHPLMTFPGPEVHLPDLNGVTAAIAGDEEALEAARTLCASLGLTPLEVPGSRALYHCAAVIAGNFATVLLADAVRVLEEAGVPRDRAAEVLLPLALASLDNAVPDPIRALTGPVARGDREVVEGHRRALDDAGLHGIRAAYDAMCARVEAWTAGGEPDNEATIDQTR